MSASGDVTIVRGDITRVPADAIVNTANPALAAGGGVCGAIFRAAGKAKLTEACSRIGHCPTGAAVATPAFNIATARWIIHAVGPVYSDHAPEAARRLLRSAYASAIAEAVRLHCRSIALPAISTGIYGYPLAEACRESVDVCTALARTHDLAVLLVAFDGSTAVELSRQLAARGAHGRR